MRNILRYIPVTLLFSLSTYLATYVAEGLRLEWGLVAVSLVDNVKSEGLYAKCKIGSKNLGKEKIRPFIMPRCKPGYGGTEYRGVKDHELKVKITDHFRGHLGAGQLYRIVMGRGGLNLYIRN